jgi:hypothetical protein
VRVQSALISQGEEKVQMKRKGSYDSYHEEDYVRLKKIAVPDDE